MVSSVPARPRGRGLRRGLMLLASAAVVAAASLAPEHPASLKESASAVRAP
jgi:hypothetical protein